MAVAIEIGYSHEVPTGRKSRTVRGADKNIVIQIPDRCLSRAGLVKHIVRVPASAKVGCSRQWPATRKGRAVSAANSRQP